MNYTIDDDAADEMLLALANDNLSGADRQRLIVWIFDCRQRRNVAECKLRELEGRARVAGVDTNTPEWLAILRANGAL